MTTKPEELAVKLEDLKLSDDIYPKYEPFTETTDEKDQLIVKYLELLDQYTQALESMNQEFKEGFINLSRANYANLSLNKPFGKDYWDERVKAIREVHVNDGTVELRDIEPVNGKDDDKSDSDSGVRNRKNAEVGEKPIAKPKKKYNPISMFGVLVPLQLRQSQSHFIKTLNPIIELVNLRNELESLRTQLKKLKAEKKKKEER